MNPSAENSVGMIGRAVVKRGRSYSDVVGIDVNMEDSDAVDAALSELEGSKPNELDELDIHNFSFPAGPISLLTVTQLIEVYRRGGHLNIDAVHKLLRLSYRRLRSSPNITRIEAQQGCSVTVVGDLHGMSAQ